MVLVEYKSVKVTMPFRNKRSGTW